MTVTACGGSPGMFRDSSTANRGVVETGLLPMMTMIDGWMEMIERRKAEKGRGLGYLVLLALVDS